MKLTNNNVSLLHMGPRGRLPKYQLNGNIKHLMGLIVKGVRYRSR